jgi:chemotaxis protein methyltransferase CheR
MDFNIEVVEISDREFELLRKLVYERSGIKLNEGKKSLVQGRLNKLLKANRFKSFRQYYDHITEDKTGDALTGMLDAISTNLTSFFREERHFDYLNSSYLPNLIQRRIREGRKSIRVWSAGCSSGEEPYSLAITVLDHLDNPSQWDVSLLATDISTKMLKTAIEGVYSKERVGSLSFGVIQKSFDKIHDKVSGSENFRVKSVIKQIIKFRHFNLMEQFNFKRPLDIIFCRNVMIYFDKQTQQGLVDKYYRNLAVGGLLFVGHSESLTGIQHSFRYVEPTIYQKTQ